jgi:methylated-DNA-protein-cysteine methyltransferase related protein
VKGEGDDFFTRVYEIVAKVPVGRVTTYGLIAQSLGTARSARAVGWALRAVARSGDLAALPCHRVVNRYGALSGRQHFETPNVMEERLHAEGIVFTDEGCVDLEKHLWIPQRSV